MTVRRLIEKLSTLNPEANVHMGYDGNIVCAKPSGEIAEINSEADISTCWWKVKVGDVVILSSI